MLILANLVLIVDLPRDTSSVSIAARSLLQSCLSLNLMLFNCDFADCGCAFLARAYLCVLNRQRTFSRSEFGAQRRGMVGIGDT